MLHFVDVDGDSASVAAAGPLWVLYAVRGEGDKGGREGRYQAACLVIVL